MEEKRQFAILISLLAERYKLNPSLELVSALRQKSEEYLRFVDIISDIDLSRSIAKEANFLSRLADELEGI